MSSTLIVEVSDNTLIWEFLIFGSTIIILSILVFWLLKSSKRLEGTTDHSEINSKIWLKNHLEDLEPHQLAILIRHYSLRLAEPIQDTKP